MKNDLRAHGILATLLVTSLGAFAFGCAAPDTADDVDEDADEPALHDQAMAVCDPAYSVCGGGGDIPPSTTYVPPPPLKIALMTSSGKYLTAAGGDAMMATATTVTAAETFEILPDATDSHFNFRTSSGKYVQAKNGGNELVYVNSLSAGNFESFTLVNLASGKTGFKSYYGYDLAAVNTGGSHVITAANPNPTWRTFTMVDVATQPMPHTLCSVGAPLSGYMNSCVVKVCAASSLCCSSYWSDSCVATAVNVCAISC